jgi:hypothetical protein
MPEQNEAIQCRTAAGIRRALQLTQVLQVRPFHQQFCQQHKPWKVTALGCDGGAQQCAEV